ncbi:DUF6758 family protein [Nocardioides sp.]|uniref:DUF6758 family protein n=1 Tax=Nocardioides sp. TaxID=35761 RepID=UPI002399BF3C|nr:DUF6758 family protein [Nocardioides sp.]MDE0778711.1 hypothetical protein [Nocardioides sp.]
MSLKVGCPRCPSPVIRSAAGWECLDHGRVDPLWRPTEVSYDAFADHLRASTAVPTYLPWPLSPGWHVTDFACVGAEPERSSATMTCCSGTSALDGPVDVLVVTEEPGVGLGARVAGTGEPDPGAAVHAGQPAVRVRIERQVVPLWPVSVSGADGEWDRSVVAGEAAGRWIWLVLRPASAVLLLRDDWILRDAAQSGPHLVDLPFGGPAPTW